MKVRVLLNCSPPCLIQPVKCSLDLGKLLVALGNALVVLYGRKVREGVATLALSV